MGERARGGRARLHDLEPVARNHECLALPPARAHLHARDRRGPRCTAVRRRASVRRPSRGDGPARRRQGVAGRQVEALERPRALEPLLACRLHEARRRPRPQERRLEARGQQASARLPAGRARLDHDDPGRAPQLQHRLEVRRDRRRRGEPGRHDGAAAPLYGQEGDRRGRRPPGDTALRGHERGRRRRALRPSS